MYWYVRVDRKIVGTVVASDRYEAMILALYKFNFSFEDGLIEVEPRKRK